MPTANQLPAVAWRRRFTAILTAVCVLAAVAAVTFSLPKTYSTSAYLVVNTAKPTTSDFEAQQVSQVDTQTAAQLLQTRNAADLVSHQLPFALTPAEVQSKTSISAIAQTQLVLITAEGSSPLRAQQLANVYADAFTRTTAPTISYARISVTEPAPLVTTPSAPRVSLFLIIGAVLALAGSIGGCASRAPRLSSWVCPCWPVCRTSARDAGAAVAPPTRRTRHSARASSGCSPISASSTGASAPP
jgi:capsular polysaccharide biosynthesis protein